MCNFRLSVFLAHILYRQMERTCINPGLRGPPISSRFQDPLLQIHQDSCSGFPMHPLELEATLHNSWSRQEEFVADPLGRNLGPLQNHKLGKQLCVMVSILRSAVHGYSMAIRAHTSLYKTETPIQTKYFT